MAFNESGFTRIGSVRIFVYSEYTDIFEDAPIMGKKIADTIGKNSRGGQDFKGVTTLIQTQSGVVSIDDITRADRVFRAFDLELAPEFFTLINEESMLNILADKSLSRNDYAALSFIRMGEIYSFNDCRIKAVTKTKGKYSLDTQNTSSFKCAQKCNFIYILHRVYPEYYYKWITSL